jgi:N-acetylglucosamine transport system permease protein
VFVLWPFAQAFIYSLTNWGGFSDTFDFVGLANYKALVHDDIFLKAVRNNLLLALVVPFVTIVLSLALATMVTVGGSSTGSVRGLDRSSFYRIVSFFPYTIPAIVIGLIWAQMFDPSSGLVNGVLTGIGLDRFQSFAWLGEVSTAMPVTMFVIIWGFVGFYMVLFVAAIKGIPAELYDAARVDGAGAFQMFRYVTFPWLAQALLIVLILQTMAAIRAFDVIYVLTAGGPGSSTTTLTWQTFLTTFESLNFGLGNAYAWTVSVITLSLAVLYFRVLYRRGEIEA